MRYVVEYLEEYLLIESVDSLTTTGRRLRRLHPRLECSQLCTLRGLAYLYRLVARLMMSLMKMSL